MANGNKGGAGIVVAVVLTLAVAGTGGYMIGNRAGQKSATLESQVVATVNNDKITKLDLYNRMVTESGAQTADSLIQEKLVDQAASKANITVTQQEIDDSINKIKQQVGGEDQFQSALAQANMTMDQLKKNQEFRLKITKILSKDIPTDDATLKKFFDDNTSQFDKRQVHARHILVATEDEAKAIKAQLDAGGDFAAIAKAKSTDTSNKDQGGDLGFFGSGQMDPAFEKAAFSMKKGEISAPVQTTYGWHIIQVVDTTGTAPTFDAVKADVKSAYIDSQVQEKAPQWLTEQKDAAKISNSLAPATPPANK